MKNNTLKIAAGLAAVVGVYLIYKYFKKPQSDLDLPGGGGVTPPPPPAPTPSGGGGTGGGTPAPKPIFPLSLGSRGAKVKELQEAIITTGDAIAIGHLGKAGADGKFGTGTEKAINHLIRKNKIDSQEDIEKIKKIKGTREGKSNRIALANTLIAKFKDKPATSKFYAIWTTSGSIGKVTSDGREILESTKTWNKNDRIGFSKNATFKVSSDGFITAYDGSTYTYFSPYGAEVR